MKMDKVFPSQWLAAVDTGEHGIDVTVRGLTQEEVGQEREIKPVLWFEEEKKGLILNKTNWQNITKILGSEDSDDWKGKKIQLFTAAVQFGGKEVDAIRVRPVGGRNAGRAAVEMPVATGDLRIDLVVEGTIIKKQQADSGRVGVLIRQNKVGADGKPIEFWAAIADASTLENVKNIGGTVAACSLHKHTNGKFTLVSIAPAITAPVPGETTEAGNEQGDLDGLPF